MHPEKANKTRCDTLMHLAQDIVSDTVRKTTGNKRQARRRSTWKQQALAISTNPHTNTPYIHRVTTAAGREQHYSPPQLTHAPHGALNPPEFKHPIAANLSSQAQQTYPISSHTAKLMLTHSLHTLQHTQYNQRSNRCHTRQRGRNVQRGQHSKYKDRGK